MERPYRFQSIRVGRLFQYYEMLGNAGYAHGDILRLHVGVYGYDGIRTERTDGLRAGRRP